MSEFGPLSQLSPTDRQFALERAVREYGNVSAAARELGIARSTFRRAVGQLPGSPSARTLQFIESRVQDVRVRRGDLTERHATLYFTPEGLGNITPPRDAQAMRFVVETDDANYPRRHKQTEWTDELDPLAYALDAGYDPADIVGVVFDVGTDE